MEILPVNRLSSPSYLGVVPGTPSLVDFAQRLATLRKEKALPNSSSPTAFNRMSSS